MDECPLGRHVENLKLLKNFDQTGHVAIPISEWIRFFEALTFLAHGDGHREIYCAVGTRYVVFSKTPIERKPRAAPRQRDLFDLEKPTGETVRPALLHPDGAFAPSIRGVTVKA